MEVLGIVSIFLSFVCILYTIHVSIVYSTFNKNVKTWSENLDNSTRDTINRVARNIIRDLDKKISDLNEKKEEDDGKE